MQYFKTVRTKDNKVYKCKAVKGHNIRYGLHVNQIPVIRKIEAKW